MNQAKQIFTGLFLFYTALFLSDCGKSSDGMDLTFLALMGSGSSSAASPSPSVPILNCTSTPCSIQAAWDANRESQVNAAGGGYKICYSQTPNFTVSGGSCPVDVPFSAAMGSSPTKGNITLAQGQWYVKVYAYSQYNTGSLPSAEYRVNVP